MAGVLARLRDAAAILVGASDVRVVRNEVPYEAGNTAAKRTARWQPTNHTANGFLGSLGTIRSRSRESARNNPYGKGVIDKLVTNVVGTGIKPLSQAKDPAFRRQVHELWLRWTDQSDADGQLDFYGQTAQAVRCWLEGGEAFGRLRMRMPTDGLAVPMQVQVLEPELCPYTHSLVMAGGARVRGGIEFDVIGRRIAYYFHPSRPELDDFDASQLRRVAADTVTHLYDPARPGQLRGLPHLTPALVKLHELDKLDDATLLRQQLANMFALFVKRPADPAVTDQVHPLTGEPVEDEDAPLVHLEPGLAQELNPGEEIEFSDPPDPPQGLADFMRLHLRAIAVATGVPYEVLTGDMTGMNDRTVRVVLNEFKRRMQQVQHGIVVFRFCRPIWNAWFDRAVLAGALNVPNEYWTNPDPWRAVKWMPQRWAYIHPVQDIEAEKEAVRAGFTSRSAVVSEYGEDAEAIDQEQRDDNARADELGLAYTSDGRKPAGGGAASAASGQPADPASGDPPQ